MWNLTNERINQAEPDPQRETMAGGCRGRGWETRHNERVNGARPSRTLPRLFPPPRFSGAGRVPSASFTHSCHTAGRSFPGPADQTLNSRHRTHRKGFPKAAEVPLDRSTRVVTVESRRQAWARRPWQAMLSWWDSTASFHHLYYLQLRARYPHFPLTTVK